MGIVSDPGSDVERPKAARVLPDAIGIRRLKLPSRRSAARDPLRTLDKASQLGPLVGQSGQLIERAARAAIASTCRVSVHFNGM